jgi:hypothetical protein
MYAERMPRPEPRRPARERPRPPAPHALLALQRSAGNAAVTRMLARFEAGEHAQMGGSGKARVGKPSVEVSEADLVALGDFYASSSELMTAPKEQIEALVALIHRDREFRVNGTGTPPTTDEWTQAKPDYAQLQLENASHFAPDALPGGTDHRTMFYAQHRRALELASVSRDGSVPNDALVVNAYACHFLTDAFAAGHLFNKGEMLERVRAAWQAQDTVGVMLRETTFTKEVARKVLADATAAQELGRYEAWLGTWKPIDATVLSEFTYQISQNAKTSEKFFNGLLNLVHTRLNTAPKDDPATAIEVSNRMGMTWRLAGDGTVNGTAAGEQTLLVAQEAVAHAGRNLQTAARMADRSALDPLIDAVWAYTPRPTKSGAEQMQALIRSALTLDSERTTDEFAKATIDNLATVISEATKEGYMRRR